VSGAIGSSTTTLPLTSPEDRIEGGVRALIARFEATQAGSMIEHLRIVDEPHVRTQFAWLRRNRRDLWDQLRPVILASWHRVYDQTEQRALARETARQMEADRQARFMRQR
jgi:hypothetical protein